MTNAYTVSQHTNYGSAQHTMCSDLARPTTLEAYVDLWGKTTGKHVLIAE